MTEQKRAAVEYTQEELETMVKAVLNGATIGDVCNVSQDMLESLYSLGYNLYTSGNYKDAETVFSGLCLYDHNDPRFWMGLAGSRQANGKYQEAVDAYGLCSAMGALASPVPLLQAGMCYLKMGDREKAKGAFVVALSMGEEGNPEHDAARGKASAMLAILAGGVEVNNLQEAIKKALQEITLPDLPPSSPNASSSSSDLPRLAPPTAGGLSLETLAQMISNETRTQATKDGVASIEAKGKERAEINEKKLEEIMDRLDSMKSKGILDIFKKIFSVIGVIIGAIASVATIAAGVMTGNPLLIVGGGVMFAMSINSAMSLATDGEVSISAGITAGLKKLGVPEDIAGYIGMGVELAITLVGVGLTMGGSFGSAASTAKQTLSKVADIALKATNIASGVVQMGSGATDVAGSVYDYKISTSYADTKELEAILERIQQAQDMELDFLKGIMERAEKMVEDVNNIIEGCTESQTAILTNVAPTMA